MEEKKVDPPAFLTIQHPPPPHDNFYRKKIIENNYTSNLPEYQRNDSPVLYIFYKAFHGIRFIDYLTMKILTLASFEDGENLNIYDRAFQILKLYETYMHNTFQTKKPFYTKMSHSKDRPATYHVKISIEKFRSERANA